LIQKKNEVEHMHCHYNDMSSRLLNVFTELMALEAEKTTLQQSLSTCTRFLAEHDHDTTVVVLGAPPDSDSDATID
jgi:hypothetical protein